MSGFLSLASEPSIRSEWLDAYLQMERGERMASAAKTEEALAFFQKALAAFQKIAVEFPEWNVRMVAYRIAYCRGRCRDLEESLNINLHAMNIDELKQRLEAEITKNRGLLRENEALRNSKAIRPPDGANRELDKLASENASLKASLAQAQEHARRSELKEHAWKQSAAGADKARQTLTDTLLERDELRIKLKERDLDVADLNAKVKTLLEQLAKADKWANTPYNSANAIKLKEMEEMSSTISKLQTELNAFRQKDKETKIHKKLIAELVKMAAGKEKDGDDASAARYWAAIAKEQPDNPGAALRAAVWFAKIGMTDEANFWGNAFFDKSFSDATLLAALSGELLQMGELDRALALAACAAALQPDKPDPRYVLASVYVAEGFLTAAEAQYRQVLITAPTHVPTLLALATILATSTPQRLTEARNLYITARKNGAPPDTALEIVLAE